ncbi:hypothetical protein ACWDUI_29435 [Streptosporangium sandarakinum]
MHSRPSDVIAEQIRKHRDRLSLTREQLARECAKLGAPQLTFGALTNIETGRKDPKTGLRRREVTIEELLVISYALAVPPLLLLIPGDAESVPMPPDWQSVHPRPAWGWVNGSEPPSRTQGEGGALVADQSRIRGDGPTRLEAWQAVLYPVRLYEDHTRAMNALRRFDRAIAEAASEEERQALRADRTPALDQLAEVIGDMMSAGIRPPALAPDLAEEIRRTGRIKYPEALPVLTAEKTGNDE